MKIGIAYNDIFGEKQISVLSADHVYPALLASGYEAERLPISKGLSPAKLKKFDLIFNLLYGEYGEDGQFSALLESLGIRYLGPFPHNCLLTFNKKITKEILVYNGIKVPAETTTPPFILKPTCGGSSINIILIKDSSQIKKISQDRRDLISEEFLPGREFSLTAFVKNKKLFCLPPVEVKKKGVVFTGIQKYSPGNNFLQAPAKITKELKLQLEEICCKCFSILDCSFYTKVDVILDKREKPKVIEVDGIPGFGPKSVITRLLIFLPKRLMPSNVIQLRWD